MRPKIDKIFELGDEFNRIEHFYFIFNLKISATWVSKTGYIYSLTKKALKISIVK